jgi:hypothetical protein
MVMLKLYRKLSRTTGKRPGRRRSAVGFGDADRAGDTGPAEAVVLSETALV